MGTYASTRSLAPAVAAGVVALVLGALGLGGAAHAHGGGSATQPRKVSSDPSAGETLHQAPDRVSITFDEPLDDSSEIAVIDDCDRRLDHGNTQVELNEMSVGIARKPSGTYHVSYKATGIGGATGTRFASFQFEVHMGPACDGGAGHRHSSGNGEGPGHEHPPGNGQHEGGNGEHEGGHAEGGPGEDHGTEVHGQRHARAHDAGHPGEDHRGPGPRGHDHDDQAAGGERAADEVSDLGDLALGEGEPAADGGAVLVGLSLAMALGILGGWVLRIAPS